MTSSTDSPRLPVSAGVCWGSLLLALAVMSWVNAETSIPGMGHVTLFVVITGALVLVVGPVAVRGGHLPRSRWPWVSLLAGLALFAHAAAGIAREDAFVIVKHVPHPVPVDLDLRLVPLASAVLAMLTAFVIVALIPRGRTLCLLWWLSAALVPLSVLGWFRIGGRMGSLPVRLWTHLGGAAVYPVVLLVGLGVAVAGILCRHRVRWSWWLALTHSVLLLLTGSRGALLMVGAFVVLLLLRLGRQRGAAGARLGSVPPAVYLVAVVAIGWALSASPILDRLDDRSGGRMMTWRIGINALGGDVGHWLFGLGYGRIWPWYAYESGWLPLPYRSRVVSSFGTTLYHSHSLYLEVLAELGLLGLLLLGLVVAPLVVRWWRGGDVVVVVLTSTAGAALVGFNFDLLLFKNFGVSLVWWVCVFAALMGAPDDKVRPWTTGTRHVPAEPVPSGPTVEEP